MNTARFSYATVARSATTVQILLRTSLTLDRDFAFEVAVPTGMMQSLYSNPLPHFGLYHIASFIARCYESFKLKEMNYKYYESKARDNHFLFQRRWHLWITNRSHNDVLYTRAWVHRFRKTRLKHTFLSRRIISPTIPSIL